MQIKMHTAEIEIDAALVRRLLADQFPHLAEKPLRLVRSTGTVNAIYRLGDDLYVRLPRVAAWTDSIIREWTWLPKLAPFLSLAVPQPAALGAPTAGFPYPWSIYQWIDGSLYEDDLIADERQAAGDLAKFILELRGINTAGAPRGGRRPLQELDAPTQAVIESLADEIDAQAALAAWKRALAAPPWRGEPVWIHGDLLRPNLLVKDAQLRAVIDFGGVGIGDPATDVIAAWSVFSAAGRESFRTALEVDDATWSRAAAYALHQALMIIPYYPKTNPVFVAQAQRTVREVLADSA